MTDSRSFERAKRDHVVLHLNQAHGKMMEAARTLQVTRMTLYRLIKRFEIKPEEYRKVISPAPEVSQSDVQAWG